jgi:hypothetical protein
LFALLGQKGAMMEEIREVIKAVAVLLSDLQNTLQMEAARQKWMAAVQRGDKIAAAWHYAEYSAYLNKALAIYNS